jgi:DNA invertase Pin-like site-specific DNA recombinase
MKTKFIGLVRVSTQKQMRSGNSVHEQCGSIEKYAGNNNGKLIEIVKIQASGKKQLLNVGQLSESVKRAKEIGAEIIVTKIDRLSRDQITLLMLKRASTESGVEIHITSMNRKISEISDLEFTLISTICQEEARLIRSRAKLAARNRQGSIGRTLDPSEMGKRSVAIRSKTSRDWAESINLRHHIQDAVNKLRNPTQDSVCNWLNGQDVLTIRGNRWTRINFLKQLQRLKWNWSEFQQN